MINNGRNGFAFFTVLDFGLATRDGTATMPATIITANRMFDFPLGVNHPQIKVAGNRVHLVFQGQMVLGAEFNNYAVDRGAYYVGLDADGTVVVPPVELFRKNIPSPRDAFPRIALDPDGNVHPVGRGGACALTPVTGTPTICQPSAECAGYGRCSVVHKRSDLACPAEVHPRPSAPRVGDAPLARPDPPGGTRPPGGQLRLRFRPLRSRPH